MRESRFKIALFRKLWTFCKGSLPAIQIEILLYVYGMELFGNNLGRRSTALR